MRPRFATAILAVILAVIAGRSQAKFTKGHYNSTVAHSVYRERTQSAGIPPPHEEGEDGAGETPDKADWDEGEEEWDEEGEGGDGVDGDDGTTSGPMKLLHDVLKTFGGSRIDTSDSSNTNNAQPESNMARREAGGEEQGQESGFADDEIGRSQPKARNEEEPQVRHPSKGYQAPEKGPDPKNRVMSTRSWGFVDVGEDADDECELDDGNHHAWPGPEYNTWYPPDPMLAVGPSHVIAVVNGAVVLYDKLGQEIEETTLSGFFGSSDSFDPKIVYDGWSERFFIIALNGRTSPVSYVELAMSTTATPGNLTMGDPGTSDVSWWGWSFDADKNGATQTMYWIDYPGFSVDRNAVIITGNMYSTSPVAFQYAKVYIVVVAEMLSGNTTLEATEIWDLEDEFATTAATIVPATVPNHAGGVDAMDNGLAFAASTPRSGHVVIWEFDGTDVIGGAGLVGTERMDVNAFNQDTATFDLPDADQLGVDSMIEVGDNRIMNAVYRNGSLWTVLSARSASATSEIAWYEVNVGSTTGGTPTLTQEGRVSKDGGWLFFPAIYPMESGHVALVASAVDEESYAGIYAADRAPSDSLGEMSTPWKIIDGCSSYELGLPYQVRWGDYAGISEDASDPGRVWIMAEVASAVEDEWATWVTSWCPDPTQCNGNCTNRCSDAGFCLDEVCYCYEGYEGDDCSTQLCPNDCSGAGTCADGVCTCDWGFDGVDCSLEPTRLWPGGRVDMELDSTGVRFFRWNTGTGNGLNDTNHGNGTEWTLSAGWTRYNATSEQVSSGDASGGLDGAISVLINPGVLPDNETAGLWNMTLADIGGWDKSLDSPLWSNNSVSWTSGEDLEGGWYYAAVLGPPNSTFVMGLDVSGVVVVDDGVSALIAVANNTSTWFAFSWDESATNKDMRVEASVYSLDIDGPGPAGIVSTSAGLSVAGAQATSLPSVVNGTAEVSTNDSLVVPRCQGAGLWWFGVSLDLEGGEEEASTVIVEVTVREVLAPTAPSEGTELTLGNWFEDAVNISWSAAGNAESYEVWQRSASDMEDDLGEDEQSMAGRDEVDDVCEVQDLLAVVVPHGFVESGSVLQAQVIDLLPESTYEWNVIAVSADGARLPYQPVIGLTNPAYTIWTRGNVVAFIIGGVFLLLATVYCLTRGEWSRNFRRNRSSTAVQRISIAPQGAPPSWGAGRGPSKGRPIPKLHQPSTMTESAVWARVQAGTQGRVRARAAII